MWDFEDLWLTVDGQAGGYTLEVRASGGVAQAPVAVVYQESPEITATLEKLAQFDDISHHDLERVGTYFYDFLIKPIDDIYRGSRAAAQGKFLRIWLRIRPLELSDLPWELLFDPRDILFLAWQGNCTLIRMVDSSVAVAPYQSTAQKPTLAHLLSSPYNRARLDLDASWETVQKAWQGRATIRTLRPAVRDGLVESLQGATIAHFDGHAFYDAQRGFYLSFTNAYGEEEKFSAQSLAQELAGLPIRLWVLMACTTGKAGPLWHRGVAQQLTRALPTPAVIATRYEIMERTAQAFNAAFYSAIAEGAPVEVAFTVARRAIERRQVYYGEWVAPMLFLRTAQGDTFVSPQVIEPSNNTIFNSSRTLIGHRELLRQLIKAYDRVDMEGGGAIHFLTGRRGYGRQALATKVAETVQSFGAAVVGLHFQSDSTVTPLFALEESTKWYEAVATRYSLAIEQVGNGWQWLMAQLVAQLGTLDLPSAPTFGDDARTLLAYIRTLAREKSLVVVLDELQYAPSTWLELLRYLASDAEFQGKLPVLLLATVERRQVMPRILGKDENDWTHLIHSLSQLPNNEVHWVSTVTRQDVSDYIGAAEALVAQRLQHLSGGVGVLIENLWVQWQATESVERDSDGRWIITAEGNEWVRGEQRDHLTHAIERLVPSHAPYTRNESLRLLTYAALEDETFTAQVVAELMNVEADDVMDFLDEYLLDTAVEGGIISDAGFVKYIHDGQEYFLNRYRFSQPYWHAICEQQVLRQETTQYLNQMRGVLERVYRHLPNIAAWRLLEISEQLGDSSSTEAYRKRVESQRTIASLEWQLSILESDPQHDMRTQMRLFEGYLKLSEQFYDLGRFGGSQRAAERAVELSEKWHGLLRLAQALLRLGIALYAQGEYRAAQEKEEQALAIRERVLAPTHHDIAKALGNLAGTLYAQGLYSVAREKQERALKILEQVLPHDHPDIATALGNLAVTLYVQGEYGASREKQEHTLEIWERLLRPDHPHIAKALLNLAGTLYAQGEYSAAREKQERALWILERVLPPDHSDIAKALLNLAGTLKAQAEYGESQEKQERALGILERVLPPNHPYIATALGNLALTLKAQGEYEEAREKEERVLETRERVLPPNHPDIATALNNLAGTLYAQGAYVEVRARQERVLEIRERVLPPNHPDIATALNNLATTLVRLDFLQEALEKYQRALEIRRKHFAEDHLYVQEILGKIKAITLDT